jgi:hypothetical protein
MKIFLTFDYELFFGTKTGTVENCLLKPTKNLLELFQQYKIQTTFFIDASYLLMLKTDAEKNSYSMQEWKSISAQMHEMVKNGHEIGLHLHPHWSDCFRKDEKWIINTQRYRFDLLHPEEQKEHFHTCVELIRKEFYPKLCSFRAGGWCIQPFENFRKLMKTYNITIDSSVVPGMKHYSEHHRFDFTDCFKKEIWNFETNPCKEEEGGFFTEVPVTPDLIFPLFRIKMFFLHRYRPSMYVPVGDGDWLKDTSKHYIGYVLPQARYASADGLYSERLQKIYKELTIKNAEIFTVLSHPKSLSSASFQYLENFIKEALEKGEIFSRVCDVKMK